MADTLIIDRNFKCSYCGFTNPAQATVASHVRAGHKTDSGKRIKAHVVKPKIPSWHTLRKIRKAWAHVKVSIAGARDIVACNICGDERELANQKCDTLLGPGTGEPIPADEVLSKFTRDHFYAHNLIENF